MAVIQKHFSDKTDWLRMPIPDLIHSAETSGSTLQQLKKKKKRLHIEHMGKFKSKKGKGKMMQL